MVDHLVKDVQLGNIDKVVAALNGKDDGAIIDVNAKDRKQCTLLHWAAYNNRCEIAQLLINAGANVNATGGELQESPIMWCLRRRFYRMAEILYNAGAEFEHQSTKGCDVIHNSCKLGLGGDFNSLFLLFAWGARANKVDIRGDTPLTWTVLHRGGRKAREIVRLIMKYEEDRDAYVTHREDGNNVLHIMAYKTEVDLETAFELHQHPAISPWLDPNANTKNALGNKNGVTPWNIASDVKNRIMKNFLADAMMYNKFVWYIPLLVPIVGLLICWYLITSWGWIITIIFGVIYFKLSIEFGVQFSIVRHRWRFNLGVFLGIALIFECIYMMYVLHHSSLFFNILYITCSAMRFVTGIKISRSKPTTLKPNDRNELMNQIIQSAPSEGPDDEAASVGDHEDSADSLPESRKYDSSMEKTKRQGRTRGPVICAYCQTDRRLATEHCEHSNACVVGMSTILPHLSVASAQGTRRLNVMHTGFIAATAFLFWVLLHHTQGQEESCPTKLWFPFSILTIQFCAIGKTPVYFLCYLFNLYLLCWSFSQTAYELVAVANRTTIFMYGKGYIDLVVKPNRRAATDRVITFLRTGSYEVHYQDVTVFHPGPKSSHFSIMEYCGFDPNDIWQSCLSMVQRAKGIRMRHVVELWNKLVNESDEVEVDESEGLLQRANAIEMFEKTIRNLDGGDQDDSNFTTKFHMPDGSLRGIEDLNAEHTEKGYARGKVVDPNDVNANEAVSNTGAMKTEVLANTMDR